MGSVGDLDRRPGVEDGEVAVAVRRVPAVENALRHLWTMNPRVVDVDNCR